MKIVKDSIFDSKVKQMEFNNLSKDNKKLHREKTLEDIFTILANRENRYIFYCPDIAVINNLVKLIYEVAYELKKMNFQVLILHEIDGFKCKWLFNTETYKHLKDVPVDYIIKKKGKKSKKTRSQYDFKPTDTFIVPDQFQEVLDNLLEIKLIQKVLLVSSYTGIGTLQPGTDYHFLNANNLIFIEEHLKNDYESLFKINSHLISYPINNNIFKSYEDISEIYPVITISNIGNNDLAQQIVNTFYAKYPNFKVFNFKILTRDDYDTYIDTINHSCLMLVLDKNMGNNQMIYEFLNTNTPVGTFLRRECSGELGDNIFLGVDVFEIVDNLALFCKNWLSSPTTEFIEIVKGLKTTLNFDEYSYEKFSRSLLKTFSDLHQERVKYFTQIKQSMEKQEMINI